MLPTALPVHQVLNAHVGLGFLVATHHVLLQ